MGDAQLNCIGWLAALLMVPTRQRSHTLLWGSEQLEGRHLQTLAQGLSVNQIPAGCPHNKAHPRLPTQLSSPSLYPLTSGLGGCFQFLVFKPVRVRAPEELKASFSTKAERQEKETIKTNRNSKQTKRVRNLLQDDQGFPFSTAS